jgi:hypothetical protein
VSNVSTVTPAAIITTTRTANPAAASSTASPAYNPGVITWSLPGTPITPQVQSTQSYSTTPGQVFTDFASAVLVPMPGQLPAGPTTYSTVEGGPPMNND